MNAHAHFDFEKKFKNETKTLLARVVAVQRFEKN